MCADRETSAADIPDLLALLNLLPNSHGHLRHVGIDLDETETVRDLNPDPEVVGGTCCGHLSTRGRHDRGAVAGQQVDPCVEMEITAKGRFDPERRGSEPLDDLSARNRAQELAGVDRVGGHTCAEVRTLGGIHGNHEHRAGRQLWAPNSIEAKHGGDIHAVGGGETGRCVPPFDGDYDARHGCHLERSSDRERHASAGIRQKDVSPGEVELPADRFESVSRRDDVHDWSATYERRRWNGNWLDDDAVTAQGDVARNSSV